MILSVLVIDGGASRFGLRVVASRVNVPPIGTKERGAVPSLTWMGGCMGRACEDSGVDDWVGGLIGDVGEKCRLGARYFGGGVTVTGEHLLSVDGTGIAGH